MRVDRRGKHPLGEKKREIFWKKGKKDSDHWEIGTGEKKGKDSLEFFFPSQKIDKVLKAKPKRDSRV